MPVVSHNLDFQHCMSWTFFVFNYLKCNGCSFSYWWHCRPSLFILTVHIHVRTTMDNYLWENLVISVRAIVVVIVYQNWWCEFKFLNCSASYYQKGFFLITRDESFPLISRFPSFFSQYSQTCIKRSPLGQRKVAYESGDLSKEGQLIWNLMTGQKNVTF